ncbi:hypothetical protein FIBSPDRAFT_927902 [Athelia psychrophila]|uniref:MIF4G domain-containing protein n=1 Tax=Athelia psychrophila TaxID=1759441 RepID=A0A166R5Z3_9AGAM|nr:hypothetical protein FIBSPDRAFT_927902 [Fibularhizoctonia sp. CBS 109695]
MWPPAVNQLRALSGRQHAEEVIAVKQRAGQAYTALPTSNINDFQRYLSEHQRQPSRSYQKHVETESVASLQALPIGAGSQVIIGNIDNAAESDAADAVELLRKEHGIASLEVVIANAGICAPGPALTTSLSDMRSHFEASGSGKYFVMSSAGGSIASTHPTVPFAAYGASQAAANFIARKIHHEHPDIVAVALNPGFPICFVQTDMGEATGAALGIESTLSPENSVHKIQRPGGELPGQELRSAEGPVRFRVVIGRLGCLLGTRKSQLQDLAMHCQKLPLGVKDCGVWRNRMLPRVEDRIDGDSAPSPSSNGPVTPAVASTPPQQQQQQPMPVPGWPGPKRVSSVLATAVVHARHPHSTTAAHAPALTTGLRTPATAASATSLHHPLLPRPRAAPSMEPTPHTGLARMRTHLCPTRRRGWEVDVKAIRASRPAVPRPAASIARKSVLSINTTGPSQEARKPRARPLDLSYGKTLITPGLPPALATGRITEDIEKVEYPEGIMSPRLELNVNAKDSKFKARLIMRSQYDRDILLQFVSICKEKPDQLPPLDAIGLEPIDQFCMSRGGSGRHRTTSMPMRAGSIGLGIGNFAKPGGSLSMGNFATPDGTGSSQGEGGGGPMGPNRTRSKRGERRTDSNSLKAPAAADGHQRHVTSLEVAANRWTAAAPGKKVATIVPDSPEMVDRKVKGLLNKLTIEKFDCISDQIITWANKSETEKDGRTLIQAIRLVFEMATDEAAWSEMYAHLCRKIMETISASVQGDGTKNNEGRPIAGGQLFRKRCGGGEDAAIKAANDKNKDAPGEDEPRLYSEEYYAASKAKRQGLALIKVKRPPSNVENPEEEEIESLCKFLSTVGALLDTPKARAIMDVYFSRMKELARSGSVTSRMQFILQDVVELHDRKWSTRNVVAAIPLPRRATFPTLGTDPISRSSSSSNMFSMLSQNSAIAADASGPKPTTSRLTSRKTSIVLGTAGVPEAPLQRRKLQLLPRLKMTEDGGDGTAASTPVSENGEVEESGAAADSISEADAKKHLDQDSKELFAVRNLDEAEDYFQKLTPEHRFCLADKLINIAIESKAAGAQLVGDFARAHSKDYRRPAFSLHI